MKKETALISACLLGIPCQYDGNLAKIRLTKKEIENLDIHLVPVCPEQLSGLPTPRKPVEIKGGDGSDVLKKRAKVISQDGEDFTKQFILGAENVLKIAKTLKVTKMITQFRSPSCSSMEIYNGEFSHLLQLGLGVTAALLQSNDIDLLDVTTLKGNRK